MTQVERDERIAELEGLIKGAIRISSIWLYADEVGQEHRGEAEALTLMYEQFCAAIALEATQ